MPPDLADRPPATAHLGHEGPGSKEPPLCASTTTTTSVVHPNVQASSLDSFSLASLQSADRIAATGSLPQQDMNRADVYCKYAPVHINGLSGMALMDSGNTWRTVISKDFAEQLGLNLQTDLKPLRCTSVGTAKEDSNLEVLGETKKFMHLTFSTCPTKFKFKPVVIEGLSMPINISGPFMRKHQIDQLHSRNSLRIQTQIIPLYETAISPDQMEKSE